MRPSSSEAHTTSPYSLDGLKPQTPHTLEDSRGDKAIVEIVDCRRLQEAPRDSLLQCSTS